MEKHDANQNDERRAAIISADANRYVKYWTDAEQLKPATPRIWATQDGQLSNEQTQELFMADYRKDHAAANAEIIRRNINVGRSKEPKVPRIAKSALDAAIIAELTEKTRLKLEDTRARLAFDPAADPGATLLTAFVANLTTENVEVAAAVIGNYIWAAKRRLMGLPVEYALLPVIVGKQGIGKSRNVDRLLSPLSDYKLDLLDVSYLTDSRRYQTFADNYVAVLDDLPTFSMGDINILKNFITATSLKAKNYRTSEILDSPNRVTIISTANCSVKHNQGATRRIYEITVNKEISQQVSAGIDYTKCWQSIDENGPSPILPYLPTLTEK